MAPGHGNEAGLVSTVWGLTQAAHPACGGTSPRPGTQVAAAAAAGSKTQRLYLGPMSAGCRSPATRATR